MTEARKILPKGNAQPPTNSVKASGDAGGKPQVRHKNKDKIPKSLRFDLENALVGLCDVWFEEIKPYLVRNNVKVHVHDGEAGGGDREDPAPECLHLDPVKLRASGNLTFQNRNCQSFEYIIANNTYNQQRQRPSVDCADSYSTPQTASRARFPKPPSQPVSSLKPDRAMESPCPNCKKDPKKSRRRKRQTVTQSPPRQLVPRLCRTYSIPPDNTLTQPVVNNNNIGLHSQKPLNQNIFRNPLPKQKMKDVSTLTEKRVKEHIERKVKPQSKEVKKEKSQSPLVKKNLLKVDVVKTVSKKRQPRSLSPQFGRCQATTTFFPQKVTTKNPEPALFQDDLINIISEKHHKLKTLYTSPVQEEYPSIMNLYSPTCNLLTSKQTYKSPPWR